MKKVLVFSALTFVITMGFTSCRQCEICTQDSEPEIRICDKDYDSKTEYGVTIDLLEAQGYDCK